MIFPKLLKLFFKENFALNRLFGFSLKEHKLKGILILVAIAYALLSFIFMFGYLFYDLGRILSDMNQIHILLGFLGFYTIGVTIFIVFFRASGMLFYYKDFNIIAPLPIHARTVFMAKLSVMMLMLYIMIFLVTSPMIFFYLYWSGFSIVTLIFYVISMIFLPLVPVIVLSFLSLLMAVVTSKLRASKIINLILMFAIFLGIFALSFQLNSTESNPLTGQIDLFAGLSDSYPPLGWFIDGIANHDVMSLLFLVATHSILFALFITFIFPLVSYTNKRGIRTAVKKHNKEIMYRSQPVIVSLIKKEFSKLFDITFYALNVGLGPVVLLIASVASIFYRSTVTSILSDYIGAGLDIELLLMVFIAFAIAMTYTAAISLSLEGKNFWVIKSLPIKAETIMYSKILFNVLLIAPIAIFSILMFGFSMDIPALNQLLMVLLTAIFAINISFMGAVINLYLPKFNYTNDMEVVKQSASALLGIFGGFAVIGLHGLVYYLLQTHVSMTLLLFLLSLFSLIFISIFWFVVKSKSQKLFLQM